PGGSRVQAGWSYLMSSRAPLLAERAPNRGLRQDVRRVVHRERAVFTRNEQRNLAAGQDDPLATLVRQALDRREDRQARFGPDFPVYQLPEDDLVQCLRRVLLRGK